MTQACSIYPQVGYQVYKAAWNFDGSLIALAMRGEDIPSTSPDYHCDPYYTACVGAVRIWDVGAAAPAATLIGAVTGDVRQVRPRLERCRGASAATLNLSLVVRVIEY